MKIRKRDTRKQTETGDSSESSDKQPQCSKCGKKLPSTNTKGICKRCEAKVAQLRAAIVTAVAAGSVVIKKCGPKVVSMAMKVIKK
ncbi:hypothetical protein LF907_08300 [Bifidobacterium pseudolongum]|uniref:hypothetical protein n=1 Tax=Bifidobacterium pseudolongum TaxID=1694 RepID=UPI001F0E9592|nr:hypothetical protein [Bifidobacterium pseudolongum]MCH4850590.1 hypothetical protein [Bifidobacterium pseudolongum]